MENQMEQNPELEQNPEPELSYEEEQQIEKEANRIVSKGLLINKYYMNKSEAEKLMTLAFVKPLIDLIDDQEIKEVVRFLDSHQFVNLKGIFTHFATADGDLDFYQKQRKQFEEILEEVDYTFEMIHCSNSSSSIKFK